MSERVHVNILQGEDRFIQNANRGETFGSLPRGVSLSPNDLTERQYKSQQYPRAPFVRVKYWPNSAGGFAFLSVGFLRSSSRVIRSVSQDCDEELL